MDRNKNYYHYVFSNGERHIMTPVDAHKYSQKLKIDILKGPGVIERQKGKSFDGFGWHDSLQMSFKGPAHYRSYLKEHGLIEASMNDRPMEHEFRKPIWTEDLIRKCNTEYGMQIGGVLAEALLSGELDYPDQA